MPADTRALMAGNRRRVHRLAPAASGAYVPDSLNEVTTPLRHRREGAAAEPAAFGSHRKLEAIPLPYEVYERYEELLRQHARLDSALNAAQSV